jgi:NAD(P)-dependent dehydrogenase (short-subunit alcohol dehydrogenase family)
VGASVVVTGANRGIGREVARQLAVRGDTVVLTARDQARAERAAAELGADRAVQVPPLPRRLDVTDPAGVQRVADDLAERYGRLDVLVNNAAIHYDTWQRASAADLTVVREALETNLLGAWQTTLALLPLLRTGGHGRIVNVSSEPGSLTGMGGGTPAYGVSKAALNALTRMLAAHCPGGAGPLRKSGMNRCRCRADRKIRGGPVPRRSPTRTDRRQAGPVAALTWTGVAAARSSPWKDRRSTCSAFSTSRGIPPASRP